MSSLQSKAKDVLGQGLFTTANLNISKQTFQKARTNSVANNAPSRFGVKNTYQTVRMSAADEQPTNFQVTHHSLPKPLNN
jgi:hypothetical protein